MAARGFSRAAATYERSRPSYPPAAVDFVRRTFALHEGSRVVDLAAGTGKWTRELRARTPAKVLAIEPLPAMRREFRRAVPGVRVVAGTAEHLGLPDASVDLITVAQAFHWFDAARALRELHRVLRPGGGLALVWNVREQSSGWRRKVLELCQSYEDPSLPRRSWDRWRRAFRPDAGFSPLRVRYFHHRQRLTRELLVQRYLSVSYLAALPPARQAEFVARLRALLASHPGSRGRRTLVLPYTTEVFYVRSRGGSGPRRGRERSSPRTSTLPAGSRRRPLPIVI